MRTIAVRTITGAIYVSLIISSLVFHPILLGIVIILINYFSTTELNKICSKLTDQSPVSWVIVNSFFVILTIAILNLPLQPVYTIIPLLAMPVTLLTMIIFSEIRQPVHYVAFALFGTLYISVPLILLNLIQQISLEIKIPFALAIFVIIWTNDTFAYLSISA